MEYASQEVYLKTFLEKGCPFGKNNNSLNPFGETTNDHLIWIYWRLVYIQGFGRSGRRRDVLSRI
jgi:hypothetical protein